MPRTTNGRTIHQPESARGTTKISANVASAARAKPAWMILLGRRRPARLPTINATKNIESDIGVSVTPAWNALYSRTICRKIGSAIIVPPSADLLEHLAGYAEPEQARAEQIRIDQRGNAQALLTYAATRPARQVPQHRRI